MTTDRRSETALVWGGLLIALGAVLLAQTTGLIPGGTSPWIGVAILSTIGLGFLTIYLARPARWWAVIPAGTLLSLAVVAGAGPFVPGPVAGAIFLLGLGVTFGAVAVVPSPCPPRTWAWIPAGVLTVLAAMSLGSTWPAAVLWPVLLILLGAYLVIVWARRAHRPGG